MPEKNNTEKTPSLNVWNDLEAGIAIVQPKTFGKKGLENFQSQKVLTSESLEQLHGSLKNCPKDDVLAEEPKGIKVSLMEHQRRALAWLLYRETQRPPGGILGIFQNFINSLNELYENILTFELKTVKNQLQI